MGRTALAPTGCFASQKDEPLSFVVIDGPCVSAQTFDSTAIVGLPLSPHFLRVTVGPSTPTMCSGRRTPPASSGPVCKACERRSLGRVGRVTESRVVYVRRLLSFIVRIEIVLVAVVVTGALTFLERRRAASGTLARRRRLEFVVHL